MTFIYNPISLTWDECYIINEIIEDYDFPDEDFDFDPYDQAYFYGNPNDQISVSELSYHLI